MIFWRIYKNQLYPIHDTDKLGFNIKEASYIPDEYLDQQKFIVLRSAMGLGDWGIISAMPRLLKKKYPNCKVYIPSEKLMRTLFNNMQGMWNSWSNPYKTPQTIFANNPYVDGEVDSFEGDIFHDHYRIYDELDLNVPLVKQMLRFWQFTDEEIGDDLAPELYFSDEEKELGDTIIKDYFGDSKFGGLLVSNRYDFTQDQYIQLVLKDYKRKGYGLAYYTSIPIKKTDFGKIYSEGLNLRDIDTRVQLYIRTKAEANVGNHCGVLDCISRYTKTVQIQRQFPPKHNYIDTVDYISDVWKHDLLKGIPDKLESKTTTSLKWKADLIDYFKSESEGALTTNALEIGSSLGATTRILSHLFGSVTAVDNLAERHTKSKQLNADRKNIDYVVADVYGSSWSNWLPKEEYGVVFIDCIHDYKHVKHDIENALKVKGVRFLVFDDYGLFPEVKRGIDDFINEGKLIITRMIGHYEGKEFPKTLHKILKDREGLICLVA